MKNNAIDKKHVAATAMFAIRNIPSADAFTLNKFLELVNTNGGFGSITVEQLLDAMRLLMKHVPNTRVDALLVLVELLGVHLPLLKELGLPALPAQTKTQIVTWPCHTSTAR